MIDKTIVNKERLYDLYINQKLSSVEIGKLLNISNRTVLNYLKKYNINRRTLSESQYAKNKKEVPKEFSDYDSMYDLYVTKHMTKEQLGEYFNCGPCVIDRVLKELQIHIRGSSEAKIGVQVGEAHHNWKGGVSPLELRCRQYYQNNISPQIRKRDNYTCQLCGCHSNLHTHHIKSFSSILNEIIEEHKNLDPLKDVNQLYDIIINDERFTDQNNLITYCKECHLFKIHGYNKTIRSEAS